MSAKHTPGPWRWSDNNTLRGRIATVLEVLPRGSANLSASQENMRLIAAAPDLLAALEGLSALATETHIAFSPQNVAARAAIAKAKEATS